MGLLHKVRILVGALVHKPFTPQPQGSKAGDDEPVREKTAGQPDPSLPAEKQGALDSDRVADLLSQREGKDGG
jgi:hypothetical protein